MIIPAYKSHVTSNSLLYYMTIPLDKNFMVGNSLPCLLIYGELRILTLSLIDVFNF